MRRRTTAVAALVLLLVAGLVLAVVLVQRDDRPTARVGHVVAATFDLPGADGVPERAGAASLTLPGGDLEVVVGARSEVIDADAEQQSVPPPDGGAYLPVAWRWTSSTVRWDLAGLPGEPASVVADRAPDVTLTLVQDGVRYPLQAPAPLSVNGGDDDRWFPVAVGGSEDVALVVAFDGEEQVLDVTGSGIRAGDPGRFAAYEGYEREPDRARDDVATLIPADLGAGLATTFDGEGTPASPGDGTLVVQTVSPEPYVTGLGWAPDGETWLVLPLAVDFFGEIRNAAGLASVPLDWSFYDAAPEVRVGADGAAPEPVVVLTPPAGDFLSPGSAAVAVALVGEGTTTVALEASAQIVQLRTYEDVDRADFPDVVPLAWSAQLAVD
ncbi:MAG TPA: hypothetical protein VGE77_07980 [Nocardioides sp.]